MRFLIKRAVKHTSKSRGKFSTTFRLPIIIAKETAKYKSQTKRRRTIRVGRSNSRKRKLNFPINRNQSELTIKKYYRIELQGSELKKRRNYPKLFKIGDKSNM